ncbi:MAG TPA: hypothetical protein VFC00_28780 [Micromonosporaceae bacterium]|nr:hypothetical protein [Micromonosporaceae bacterium]
MAEAAQECCESLVRQRAAVSTVAIRHGRSFIGQVPQHRRHRHRSGPADLGAAGQAGVEQLGLAVRVRVQPPLPAAGAGL